MWPWLKKISDTLISNWVTNLTLHFKSNRVILKSHRVILNSNQVTFKSNKVTLKSNNGPFLMRKVTGSHFEKYLVIVKSNQVF